MLMCTVWPIVCLAFRKSWQFCARSWTAQRRSRWRVRPTKFWWKKYASTRSSWRVLRARWRRKMLFWPNVSTSSVSSASKLATRRASASVRSAMRRLARTTTIASISNSGWPTLAYVSLGWFICVMVWENVQSEASQFSDFLSEWYCC